MRDGHSSRPAGSAWVGRGAGEAGDARTAPDQREAWQVEQHGAAETWCAAVMAGAVEGAAVLRGLETHFPELSYFVGLGVGEDLSLRDDLAARRRGVLGSMRLACSLARPHARLGHVTPTAHDGDVDSDAEPWLASLATVWREQIHSAAHLHALLSLLALSSLAHVASLMEDVHAHALPSAAEGSSRHHETRPPRSADVLGAELSADALWAEGAPPQGAPPQGAPPQGAPPQGAAPQGEAPQGEAPQGEAPQGVVALPSLAHHPAPQRALLRAMLRASLDLASFCRGELPLTPTPTLPSTLT